MTIWFGSDLHLGHKNIIDFCNRPFNNVTDMDSFFLEMIHHLVKPEDIVFLLGDICWTKPKIYLDTLIQDHKNFHLITGNHDHKECRNFKGWASVNDLTYNIFKQHNISVVLCHYPIASWRNKEHGSLHFHGHTHGTISHSVPIMENRIDVGYDNTGQVLISLPDVIDKLNFENKKLKRRQ